MARFNIVSKDGATIRYSGKPRYSGTYLKPSLLEFTEIASPVPIEWEVGDYVDYPRTGLRYYLYSIPQPSKNARRDASGKSFTYSNVQFYAASKDLEIALFRDYVANDNNVHFSTSPDVVTTENVEGIARRIEACINDLYPNKWRIEVADFDAVDDADIIEKISEPKDFALSGGTCLDALSKIYELWQDLGWIHSYDETDGKNVITIGYANKKISENTTSPFLYGKGNGLTAIKRNQTNKDEFATRLYVYGSERNLPSRYYSSKGILNGESADIRNLMLPIDVWGKTDGKPDARKAYLENAEAVAKYGIIPKVHYFDSVDSGADIYPSIEGMTIKDVRKALNELSLTDHYPSESVYPNEKERVDKIVSASNPIDNGVINEGGREYDASDYVSYNQTVKLGELPAGVDSARVGDFLLYQGRFEGEGYAQITTRNRINGNELKGRVYDYGNFTSVIVTVEITDSITKDKRVSKKKDIPCPEKDEDGCWPFVIPTEIVAEYNERVYQGFDVYIFLSASVQCNAPSASETVVLMDLKGELTIEKKRLLSPTFDIRLKQIGFDINERASAGEGKSISFKSGFCAGRQFEIADCAYEPSTDSWLLNLKRQQDDTLGMLFPNSDYPLAKDDTFVLLDIAMPEIYVIHSMNRLLAKGERLLARASKIQTNYEPSIDSIVMVESGRTLREGMYMAIEDEDIVDNQSEYILIDSLTIYEDEGVIPTYKVTLRERRKVSYKGTPSATSQTSTKPVSTDTDSKVDLAGYATEELVNSINNRLSYRIGVVEDWFEWADEEHTTIRTKYNFYTKGQLAAGEVGTEEEGGGGGGGDKTYYFTQNTPLERWVIEHNLDKYPSVTVVSSAGEEIYCDKTYVSINKIVLNFGTPISGTAFLN